MAPQVGKGYGSHDSTKLISTRILEGYGDWVVFDSIVEASAVQANPFVLRYLHDFRFAFKDGIFVYFLFSRTLGVQDTKNFTFISRMCEEDQNYFSYTELQLNCSTGNKYNKVQVRFDLWFVLTTVKGITIDVLFIMYVLIFFLNFHLILQAAYVAEPGKVLAESMTKSRENETVHANDRVLFVIFTSDENPSTSAMCRCCVNVRLWPLKLLDTLI